ncbi:hypothetical protein PLICRDRAFT_171887 [Plicaturopsis crispa FD-325 SS-3]|nr:hypothetical protein PLICRDRAFT_171887 [Plicaturopsis crispa FD-325 SS-3]
MSEETGQQPTKKLKINASNAGRILSSAPKRSRTLPATGSPALHPSKPKGKLRLLPSLPLDILFEIFGHLLPLDILHLARTTKPFRSLLMRKSSISIWKAARRNVDGFPDCPKDLCEPAYAFLAFDTRCHNCLVVGVRYVDWVLRVRYCNKCAKTCLVVYKDRRDETFAEEIARECVAFTDWPSGGYCCTVEARNRMLKEAETLDPEDAVAFDVFSRRVDDDMAAVKQHALLCAKWEREQAECRASELETLRHSRRRAILDKLKELGYSEEIKKMPLSHTEWTYDLCLFDDHPLVRPPKLLTERIWNNIKDEMIEWMEDMKDYITQNEHRLVVRKRKQVAISVLKEYKERHPTADITLGPADFWEWMEVKQILGRPDSERVCPETFSSVVEKLPAYIEQWRGHIVRGLMSQTGHRRVDTPPDLAVHVFHCTGSMCQEARHNSRTNEPPKHVLLWYPETLHHRCNVITRHDFSSRRPPDPVDEIGIRYNFFVRQKWSSAHLTFDDKASRTVKYIIEACGMDASVTTAADLDALDPRLVCLKCSYGSRCNGERMFVVRSWRSSVHHCVTTHWGSSLVRWERISDEDAAKSRDEESRKDSAHQTDNDTTRQWQCLHCIDTPSEIEPMGKAVLWIHMAL